MDAFRFVIPVAVLLTVAGAFFGIVFARFVWADEARFAGELKQDYEKIRERYNAIHAKDQETIAIQSRTIKDLMNSRKDTQP